MEDKMTNNKAIKKIYSSKIAGLLCRQGFFVIGTEPNPKKPWLDVFIFEATPQLEAAVDKIFNK